jgi:hypothetical protein
MLSLLLSSLFPCLFRFFFLFWRHHMTGPSSYTASAEFCIHIFPFFFRGGGGGKREYFIERTILHNGGSRASEIRQNQNCFVQMLWWLSLALSVRIEMVTRTHARTHVHTHTHTHQHTRTGTHEHTSTHTQTNTHRQTDTHTHTHTHSGI